MDFRIDCGPTPALGPFSRWDDSLRLHDETLLSEQSRFIGSYGVIPDDRKRWSEKPSSEQTLAAAHSVNADFVQVPQTQNEQWVIYLSADRIFQGRHVVAICHDYYCKVGSVSFQDDEDIATPHIYVQMHYADRQGCAPFERQRQCGDWLSPLEALARAMRFLDEEVDSARNIADFRRPDEAILQRQ
ncbi:hypothetical protein [Yoonia sp. 2307UL14-13]|uniref:hypothetical protein n=1 Tax=Yoonia sp. 2307UL14-13 TaxID=3126506 RepID=UPI00309CD3EA